MMHYTFNRDLDVAYAAFDPVARGPAGTIDDFLPRLFGVLDREALLGLYSLDISGRSEVAVCVLRAFEGSAQRWRGRLKVALGEGEGDGARLADVVETVTSFKSAAIVVGALTLSRLCAEAERLAQGPWCRELDDVVDAIIAESGRILAVLAPMRWR